MNCETALYEALPNFGRWFACAFIELPEGLYRFIELLSISCVELHSSIIQDAVLLRALSCWLVRLEAG